MDYSFEWDEDKYEEARSIFKDIFRITRFDQEHSDEEERLITMGYSSSSRILLVAHTERELDENKAVVRIISCRKATAAERKNYERKNRG